MKPIVEPGLVGLSARRTAPLGVIAWAAVVIVILAWSRAPAPATWIGDEAARAGSWRQDVLFAFLIAVLPLVLARATSKAAAWRRADSEWLAARATGNATILASTWIGAWAASLALALAFAALGEFGGGRASRRLAGTLEAPSARWLDASRPALWTSVAPEVEGGRELTGRLELGLGSGSGGASEVRLRARRVGDAGQDWTVDARARVGVRSALEFALPAGRGEVSFELSAAPGSERVWIEGRTIEVWGPVGPFAAFVVPFGRLALALAAWIALALGVSAWTSAPTAALFVLAAWTPFWWARGSAGIDALTPFVPGAGIPGDLSILALGRVPEAIDARLGAGTLAISIAALSLGLAGMRSWRRTG